ncbi:phosphate uptake regulator PhoU [Candidatus Woesearchaeota archaeon]|nr:phosphate uptake regulator PhoU [Candidatus Woesearchaeota archaeon]
MKRKVIKQGHNTLTITLPAKWVEQHSIKAGDELEVDHANGILSINSETINRPREVDIDVSGLDQTTISFLLRCLYRNGSNLRTVSFTNTTTTYYRRNREVPVFSVIQEEVNRLMGVEILERKNNSCLLRCMIDEREEEFNPFLNRIFFLISLMFDHLREAFEDRNETQLSLILEDHDTITRFISYCIRITHTKGYAATPLDKLPSNLLETLEVIVDIISDIAIEGIDFKNKVTAISTSVLQQCKGLFNSFREVFFKFHHRNLCLIGKTRADILNTIVAQQNKFNKQELFIVNRIQVIVNIIVRYLACYGIYKDYAVHKKDDSLIKSSTLLNL